MKVRLTLLAAIAAASLAHAPAQAMEGPIEARGATGVLAGTLSPAATSSGGESTPVVLIIPGSGATDRNGDSTAVIGGGLVTLRPSTYRLVAEGLAARGIASARIDKRGLFESRAAATDPGAVTLDDYAADARAWVAAVRQRTGAPCVWLLGHSEGGLVALAAVTGAGRSAGVCGLVLVAAPGRPLGDILRQQLRSNPANIQVLPQAMAAIDALEKGRRVEVSTMDPALLPLFRPQVQGLWISEMAVDPAQMIAAYDGPVLILQGQKDLQVSEADAVRLRGAAPKARLMLLADANHVLKAVAGNDRAANFATYGDPDLPLAPGVIDAIADFILARPKAP